MIRTREEAATLARAVFAEQGEKLKHFEQYVRFRLGRKYSVNFPDGYFLGEVYLRLVRVLRSYRPEMGTSPMTLLCGQGLVGDCERAFLREERRHRRKESASPFGENSPGVTRECGGLRQVEARDVASVCRSRMGDDEFDFLIRCFAEKGGEIAREKGYTVGNLNTWRRRRVARLREHLLAER